LARTRVWPVEALSAGSFPTADQVDALLDRGGDDASLILQRVLPSMNALRRLQERYDRVIFDIDDAIYTVPPDLSRSRVREFPKKAARLVLRGSPYASARKKRLESTLRCVDVCVTGNTVLTNFAGRFARVVVEIPTTVDPVNSPTKTEPRPPVLVWLGLPDNLQYLSLLRRPLEQLRREIEFRLLIVSSRPLEDPPLECEFVPWSEIAAHTALLSSSVGLAPLTDNPWTRGKCALRAIQYGGHALPAVASPVGITDRIVLHGTTGYLAASEREWLDSIRSLLLDSGLRNRMGEAALNHIRSNYSDEVAVRRWIELLRSLACH
jgi:hypothetical protein